MVSYKRKNFGAVNRNLNRTVRFFKPVYKSSFSFARQLSRTPVNPVFRFQKRRFIPQRVQPVQQLNPRIHGWSAFITPPGRSISESSGLTSLSRDFGMNRSLSDSISSSSRSLSEEFGLNQPLSDSLAAQIGWSNLIRKRF